MESNHARPPYQSGAGPAGRRRCRWCPGREGGRLQGSLARRGSVNTDSRLAHRTGRRQGIAPCSAGSQPAGSLLALRRSLAGRTRTSIARGRSAALIRLSYGEKTLSTGVEPASPGRQPGRIARRVRELEGPERDSNPRRRLERPASSIRWKTGACEVTEVERWFVRAPLRPEGGFGGREATHRLTHALTRRRGLVGEPGFPHRKRGVPPPRAATAGVEPAFSG